VDRENTGGNMTRLLVFLMFLVIGSGAFAAEPVSPWIHVDPAKKVFLLSTKNSSYAFAVDKYKQPRNLHWGGRVLRLDDLPPVGQLPWHSKSLVKSHGDSHRYEFPVYMRMSMYRCEHEPCMKLRKPDDWKAFYMAYETYKELDDRHLTVSLLAENGKYRVVLHYKMVPLVVVFLVPVHQYLLFQIQNLKH